MARLMSPPLAMGTSTSSGRSAGSICSFAAGSCGVGAIVVLVVEVDVEPAPGTVEVVVEAPSPGAVWAPAPPPEVTASPATSASATATEAERGRRRRDGWSTGVGDRRPGPDLERPLRSRCTSTIVVQHR